MAYYRLYDHVKPKIWAYGQTLMIVAKVSYAYSSEFDYPDDWDELRDQGFSDYKDAAIHMWLEKYHNTMYNWLEERHIPWVGAQTGDSEDSLLELTKHSSSYVPVVAVLLRDPDHITEFLLTWG